MALDQGLANWRFCFAALWFLSQGLHLPCAAPGVAAQTAAPGGPTKVGCTLIKLIFSFHIFHTSWNSLVVSSPQSVKYIKTIFSSQAM